MPSFLFVWRALEDSNLGFAESKGLGDHSVCRKTQNAERLEVHHRGERTIQTEKTAVAVFSVCMARPRGFEPLTYRFVAGHSIR